MTDDPVETMWQLFQDATGIADTYSAWAFGADSDPDFQTALGELVLEGPKRATAGLLSDYSSDDEPVPEVGNYSIILDDDGSPLCTIRTAEVRIKPASLPETPLPRPQHRQRYATEHRHPFRSFMTSIRRYLPS